MAPRVFKDSRGYFYESYNKEQFKKDTGLDIDFVQDNQSKSSFGVLRGLHFQKGDRAQAKLVRVVKGSVWDVAVDIRIGSPTFGKYYSAYLSEDNHFQFFVPRGFAHGFLTLSDDTVFQYKCDNLYNKESEGGIIWNTPLIDDEEGICWKQWMNPDDFIFSAKDQEHNDLKWYFTNEENAFIFDSKLYEEEVILDEQ